MEVSESLLTSGKWVKQSGENREIESLRRFAREFTPLLFMSGGNRREWTLYDVWTPEMPRMLEHPEPIVDATHPHPFPCNPACISGLLRCLHGARLHLSAVYNPEGKFVSAFLYKGGSHLHTVPPTIPNCKQDYIPLKCATTHKESSTAATSAGLFRAGVRITLKHIEDVSPTSLISNTVGMRCALSASLEPTRRGRT